MNKKFITYYLLTLSLAVSSQLALRNLQTISETKTVEYVSAKQNAQIIKENLLLAQQQAVVLKAATK